MRVRSKFLMASDQRRAPQQGRGTAFCCGPAGARTMLRAWLALGVAVIPVGCQERAGTQRAAPPGEPQPEEYAVLSALIQQRYADHQAGLLVIAQQTDPGGAAAADGMAAMLAGVRNSFSGEIEEETVTAFATNNGRRYHLRSRFRVSARQVLLPDSQVDEIFRARGGWPEFRRRYPGARGLLYFSRVGFNSEINQALVYVGEHLGPLAASGTFYLLENHAGAWEVQNCALVWVS